MELGLVSIEGAALAQSCVLPKNADQEVSQIYTDSSRWSLDVTTSLYKLLSCAYNYI